MYICTPICILFVVLYIIFLPFLLFFAFVCFYRNYFFLLYLAVGYSFYFVFVPFMISQKTHIKINKKWKYICSARAQNFPFIIIFCWYFPFFRYFSVLCLLFCLCRRLNQEDEGEEIELISFIFFLLKMLENLLDFCSNVSYHSFCYERWYSHTKIKITIFAFVSL